MRLMIRNEFASLTFSEGAADFKGRNVIIDFTTEAVLSAVENPTQGDFMIRQDFMVIVQNDPLQFILGHHADTEGIAEHIRIAGVVDVTVHIQIGIDRMILGDELLPLEVADGGGQIHGD